MLLDSVQFSRALRSSVENCKESIVLASAFIKTSAIKNMLQSLPHGVAVTIVSRWQPNDLLYAASDLSTYEFCKRNGYRFGISLNFHGKVYLFDKSLILLGSANLTSRGLALHPTFNFEFGTMIEPRIQDIYRLDSFLQQEVVWLNDDLFERIRNDLSILESVEHGSSATKTWTSETLASLYRPVSYLWVEELPFCKPSEILSGNLESHAVMHDFELLSLDIDQINPEFLTASFKRCRAYKWLHNKIAKVDFCSFGKLSSELHNSILDDPTPYRRNIKEYVDILFCWLSLMPEEYEIIDHRRTRSVKLAATYTHDHQ